MQTRLLAAALAFLAACGTPTQNESPAADPAPRSVMSKSPSNSVYGLRANTLAGKPLDLSQYLGKVTLFVNVASECGYTPQYEGLQQLHEELGGEDFAVVGVPSNDFGAQEPGTADAIQAFCRENYGVTFQMLEKVGTKPGDSELFDRLAQLAGERPGWNFCKYVVSKDGTEARFFPSKVGPTSDELRGAIDEFSGS